MDEPGVPVGEVSARPDGRGGDTDPEWARLRAVFHGALEHEGRAAQLHFVAEACRGAPSLEAQVVELLEIEWEAEPSPWGVEQTPQAPGYEVGARLGEGGCSVVYRAERAQGERVALKVFKWARGPAALQRRFRLEADILAGLRHPNIARIVDSGFAEDGRPFLATELVEGKPLVAFCRGAGLAWKDRLQILVEVCDAVQFAHARLVVHRDLKPSNVLVDAAGRAVVLDFGAAKLLEARTSGGMTTPTFPAPLTPDYASPEQLAGRAVSTASDIFSLGLILFELVADQRCRRAPVSGEALSAALEDLKTASEARRQLSPPERWQVARVLAGALHAEPTLRYRTVDAFADDLRRLIRQQPVAAGRARRREALFWFVRRNRVAVAVGLVAAVVSGVAAWALSHQARRLEAERQHAEVVRAFLTDLLRNANPSESKPDVIACDGMLGRGAGLVQRQLQGAPQAQGELYQTLGEAYHSLRKHEEALAMFRGAEGAWRQLPEDRVALARALFWQGRSASQLGRITDAESALRGGLGALGGDESDLELVGLLTNGLGAVLSLQGRWEESAPFLRRGLAIRQATLPFTDPQIAQSHSNLAIIEGRRHNYASALVRQETANALRRWTPNPVIRAMGQTGEARLLAEMGAHEDAVALAEETALGAASLIEEGHPDGAWVLVDLGALRALVGQFAAADEALAAALQILRPQAHERPLLMVRAWGALADLRLREGRWREASAAAEAGLAVWYETGAHGAASRASLELLAARARLGAGEVEAAAAGLAEAAVVLAADERAHAEAQLVLAQLAAARGDVRACRARGDEARGALEALLGARHEQTLEARRLTCAPPEGRPAAQVAHR